MLYYYCDYINCTARSCCENMKYESSALNKCHIHCTVMIT